MTKVWAAETMLSQLELDCLGQEKRNSKPDAVHLPFTRLLFVPSLLRFVNTSAYFFSRNRNGRAPTQQVGVVVARYHGGAGGVAHGGFLVA